MERKDLNMRDDGGGGKGLGDNKVKYSWGSHHRDSMSSGLLGGFSWPPRSYTCSFCKREFRSAQALGGHMNVHRRDRARLRQWPPWGIKSSNPNPNFSPSPTANAAATSRAPQSTYTFPSLLSSSVACFSSSYSSSSSSSGEMKMSGSFTSFVDPLFLKENDSKGTQALPGVGKLKRFMEDQKDDMFVTLDLDIGLCTDSKEDLDLELRLGYR